MEFLFPHRIARVSYLARSVPLAIAIAMLVDQIESDEPSGRSVFDVLVILALLAYWTVFVVVPRCRDLEMSGWFALLVFVPAVDLFFCGYLAWGRSKVRSAFDPTVAHVASPTVPREAGEKKSEALRKLEALRYEGVLTEQDFLRRKARLGREEIS